MLIRRAYKFRLYPNQEQAANLARQFGCSRFVFNRFLRVRIDYYAAHKEDEGKRGLAYYDTSKTLTELKRQPEYDWLREANAQALQCSLRDLDTAYSNFFNHRAEFPKFKKKSRCQSFHVPQGFRIEDNHLVLPKMTPIRVKAHRPTEGKMKSVTISCTPTGKYFASILCEVEMPEPEYKGDDIGLDLGLKSFAVLSNGEKIDSPKYLRTAEKKLKRLQRRQSRRQKGSSGYDKARHAVVVQHEKVANQRKDFQHKLSHRITRDNQAVSIEDLHVKGMLANHHLAKSIADSGWSEFVRQLTYKANWYGCRIYQVDRFFPSSKRCHACGFIKDDLRLSDREWACPECGAIHDKDVNASLNIKLFSSRTAGIAETITPVESRVTDSRKPEAVAFIEQ